jgi:hypothetical protein
LGIQRQGCCIECYENEFSHLVRRGINHYFVSEAVMGLVCTPRTPPSLLPRSDRSADGCDRIGFNALSAILPRLTERALTSYHPPPLQDVAESPTPVEEMNPELNPGQLLTSAYPALVRMPFPCNPEYVVSAPLKFTGLPPAPKDSRSIP